MKVLLAIKPTIEPYTTDLATVEYYIYRDVIHYAISKIFPLDNAFWIRTGETNKLLDFNLDYPATPVKYAKWYRKYGNWANKLLAEFQRPKLPVPKVKP